MTRRPLLTALALGPLLAGCLTLEPKYQRPAAPVPQQFPQGSAYAPQVDGPDMAKVSWRGFFVDPKLQKVIELSLGQSRTLREALANIRIARARYHVQRSELFPTIAASAEAVYGHTGNYGVTGASSGVPVTGATGGTTGATGVTGTTTTGATGSTGIGSVSSLGGVGGVAGDYREYSVDLGVSSYEVDLWGRVRSLTKEALENYLSTAEAARSARVALIAETASDYLTLAADRQQLKVSQDTVKADQTILDITQARFAGGIASELDVRQAETAVETAKADVATNATAAAQALDALNLVVGASVPEDLLPQGLDDSIPTVADAPTGLSSAVLLSRPDVLEAEHTLRAYNADIGATRAAFFPTITLTASGGTESLYLDKLFAGGTGAWTFAPNISLPIFDWGQRQANLQLSKAEREQAVAAYELAVQSAFRDVADALAQRGTIDDLIGAQTRLNEAAAVALKLSQARYERGADTFLNTLNAELTLYAAQKTLVSARSTRALNLVETYRALGGGADG